MTKIYYLTSTDPAGEIHGLDYMARAEHAEDVVEAWVCDTGGDPSTVEAHVATAGDVDDYVARVGPVGWADVILKEVAESERAIAKLRDSAQPSQYEPAD